MKEKEEIHLVFDGFGISGNIFIANYSAACCFSLLSCRQFFNWENKIEAIVTAGRPFPQSLQVAYSELFVPPYRWLSPTVNCTVLRYILRVYRQEYWAHQCSRALLFRSQSKCCNYHSLFDEKILLFSEGKHHSA